MGFRTTFPLTLLIDRTLLACCRCTCRVICSTASQPNSSRALFVHCSRDTDWTMMYYHTAQSFTAVIVGYLALYFPWVPRYATALEGLFIACPLFGFVHERRKWHSVYRAVSQIRCTDCTHKVNTGILMSGIWFTEIWPHPRPPKIQISAA